jgi:ABC-2 type transport system permease protein
MMGLIAILKNNLYRCRERRSYFILSIIMVCASIGFAVFFTTKADSKINIAVKSEAKAKNISSKYLNITWVKDRIPESELIKGRYIAFVNAKADGSFEIETLKSDDMKNKLSFLLKNPGAKLPYDKTKRGAGTNILGFLVMFVMLQGVMFMTLYSDDRELKLSERINVSPVSTFTYLLAHGIFNFLLVFLPAFLMIVISHVLLGINIGFGYMSYALLLGILTVFSTSFALFICSVVKRSDDVMMIGSAVVTLTSMLGGTFHSFEEGNKAMEHIVSVLPQKNFLTLVQGLEKGGKLINYLPQTGYILSLSLILFLLAGRIAAKSS